MPKIMGVATASPPYRMSQSEVKQFAQSAFVKHPEMERLLSVFDHAEVEERQFVVGLDWFQQNHDFTRTNDRYIESAIALSKMAVRGLIEKCEVALTSIDAIFFVSTTGLSTPSLDARLFNELEFNAHIKRIPIWGLGCAGGAAAIARAHDYLRAYPTHRALILSVEVCSLAFQREYSKSNLISTALFGDGAAACLMIGDQVDTGGDLTLATCATMSTLYPNTLDIMGWKITGDGLQVQLSRDIPSFFQSQVKPSIEEFFDRHGLSGTEIDDHIMHPGGAKILRAYAESMNVSRTKLCHSIGVLRDHGNMSSATVLFVLKRILEFNHPVQSRDGLLSAMGPGFSSELVWVQWQ